MNYLSDKPNSPSIKNKNNLGISFQVIHLTRNRARQFLRTPLYDVIGVRVRTLSFGTQPANIAGSQIIILSCDDMAEKSKNESTIITVDPADPTGSTLFMSPKSILATWLWQPVGVPPISIPNYNTPNFEQSIIWFEKPMCFTNLTFTLETDLVELSFDSTNKVILVLEFFYHLETEK
jgi:hypothetical protein